MLSSLSLYGYSLQLLVFSFNLRYSNYIYTLVQLCLTPVFSDQSIVLGSNVEFMLCGKPWHWFFTNARLVVQWFIICKFLKNGL